MVDYSVIVDQMTERYRLRVRRWRPDESGCAWQARAGDGIATNWIEAPYPNSVLRLAIFLHEVGHHAIGLDKYELRCEAEYNAWRWVFERLREYGIEPGREVYERYDLAIRYAVFKEMSSGVRDLPACLAAFAPQAA